MTRSAAPDLAPRSPRRGGFSWRMYLAYNLVVALVGTLLRSYFAGDGPRGFAVGFAVFAIITFTISGIMEVAVPLVDGLVRRRPPRVQLAALNALYLVGGGAGFVVAFHVVHAIFGFGQTREHVVTWLGVLGAGLIAVLIGNLVHTYERLRGRLRESEAAVARQALERERLETLRVEAELAALQARINPHFLFNTLNSLAALIPTDPAAAEEMTQRLADCFRYALRASHGPVTLREELAFVEDYLALERLRFGSRLDARVALEPSAAEVRVPGLVVQPLVENALKHGIGPLEGGGAVRVRARLEDGAVIVTVEDDGRGLGRSPADAFARGTGLANVRDRLRNAHGEGAELRLEPLAPRGTRAVLRVPQLPAGDLVGSRPGAAEA